MTAVLVVLPDGRSLGFPSAEALADAFALGKQMCPPAAEAVGAAASADDERLLDAEELAAALNLPRNWIEEHARSGEIPHIRAGRWVRYRRSAVEAALRVRATRSGGRK